VNAEMLKTIERMYDNEATDSIVYGMMARRSKSENNREILEHMSRDELKHQRIWAPYVKREPKAHRWRVRLYDALSKIFGLTFVINLMESSEGDAVKACATLGGELPVALEILEDESRHEDYLVSMLEEGGLSYISSIVLGLNDALVELTGALAGFTLALGSNKTIGLAGFITGVAATLSMAASEYLAKKADPGERRPVRAATYTGIAYLFTVTLLLAPYALFSAPLTALAFCLANAALIIAGFTYFVSVVRKTSFVRGFGEMIGISFGVALVSFLIGWLAGIWLGLDV
jgi:VIT1/CCC1 family predicted Fe2+/Mn2+ transporter